MRVILTGVVSAFRLVDMPKGSSKVGQIDIVQAGDKRYATKVVSVYIPNGAYCRLIAEHLQEHVDPIISLLCWLKEGKELEIEVVEMLTLTEGVLPSGRNANTNRNTDSNTDPDSDPDPNADSDDPTLCAGSNGLAPAN
ncbi:hypothetical protein SAMN04487969_15517 [Paenibacillus algorifonticola]|uniref:Uncharacterized protein n=1 Tax=Paenibacillus algorifonticola TaxID=684063 RepID=A0A1I2J4H9_9BACL|nr:hypothetical protein [Paenibacillus algorifonticola]SFF49434.1 hypothetical protein SAMN04487969_15517 [Paenibacillus algorifonticola]